MRKIIVPFLILISVLIVVTANANMAHPPSVVVIRIAELPEDVYFDILVNEEDLSKHINDFPQLIIINENSISLESEIYGNFDGYVSYRAYVENTRDDDSYNSWYSFGYYDMLDTFKIIFFDIEGKVVEMSDEIIKDKESLYIYTKNWGNVLYNYDTKIVSHSTTIFLKGNPSNSNYNEIGIFMGVFIILLSSIFFELIIAFIMKIEKKILIVFTNLLTQIMMVFVYGILHLSYTIELLILETLVLIVEFSIFYFVIVLWQKKNTVKEILKFVIIANLFTIMTGFIFMHIMFEVL